MKTLLAALFVLGFGTPSYGADFVHCANYDGTIIYHTSQAGGGPRLPSRYEKLIVDGKTVATSVIHPGGFGESYIGFQVELKQGSFEELFKGKKNSMRFQYAQQYLTFKWGGNTAEGLMYCNSTTLMPRP